MLIYGETCSGVLIINSGIPVGHLSGEFRVAIMRGTELALARIGGTFNIATLQERQIQRYERSRRSR
jgi:hypothetical protein